MRHVERSPADDVAQTGDDKDCTGAWDTAEEVGGGEYWNETGSTVSVADRREAEGSDRLSSHAR